MNGAGRIPMLPRPASFAGIRGGLCSMGDTPQPTPPLPPHTPLALAAWRSGFMRNLQTTKKEKSIMKKLIEMMEWNGQTLKISLEPNDVLSRITGEVYANLKVIDLTNNCSVMNDAMPIDLILSAGDAGSFVDVMLSAAVAQAA